MTNLKVIPYAEVEAAIAWQRETLREQRSFNTKLHSRSEIEGVLPQVHHFSPEQQPWILISSWLDLISSSQGISECEIHRIELPGKFLVQLIPASKVVLQMGHLPQDDADDLADAFPKHTTQRKNLEKLIQENEFFVRMDTCSLKDSSFGKGSIKGISDLWTLLVSSARGMAGIRDLRAHDPSRPISMYLLPWQNSMRTDLEYRVYCPPSTDRIAAISQYKWHERWYHASDTMRNQAMIADRLVKSCKEVHVQILAHPSMTDSLRDRGFVFDVYEDPGTQQIRLIELNDFGALSGCGACLFHWIRDAHLLYGKQDRIEVRVTI